MSVDPAQPSAPDPTPPRPPADPAGENAESLRLKRRFKRASGEAEEGGEKPDQAIEVLSSLLQDLVARKDQRPASAPEPAAPPSKSAKFHRLSKTGSGTSPAPAEAGPAPSETSLPPASGAAPAPPPVSFRPAPVFDPEAQGRHLRQWKVLALVSLLALVGLTGYVVWFLRLAANPNAPAAGSRPTSTWTDAALEQLDRALAADQAGNLAEARRIASDITPPRAAPPPGLSLYLANLQIRTQHNFDAEADLLHLSKSDSPETLAAIDKGLVFNFLRQRDFAKAADAVKNAIKNDPFSASPFYDEGEVARRTGHLPDAVASFRRALDRVPTGQPEAESLRECIGLKLRLCLVELGREGEFQAELDEQLRSPSPSGYWLLTAAAVALQRKDPTEAAGLLGRARSVLGGAQFDALLNDYFFRAYADRKELAEFFPDPSTRRAKLLPTMTRTIEP